VEIRRTSEATRPIWIAISNSIAVLDSDVFTYDNGRPFEGSPVVALMIFYVQIEIAIRIEIVLAVA